MISRSESGAVVSLLDLMHSTSRTHVHMECSAVGAPGSKPIIHRCSIWLRYGRWGTIVGTPSSVTRSSTGLTSSLLVFDVRGQPGRQFVGMGRVVRLLSGWALNSFLALLKR